MNAITEFMSKHFAPSHQQPGIIAAREELAAEQAARRAALWMGRDHAEALFDNATHDNAIELAHAESIALNAKFDADRQELARLQMDSVARQEAAFRLAYAHADALDDNAIIGAAIATAHVEANIDNFKFDISAIGNMQRAADLARHTANAAALLADARVPMIDSMTDDDIIEFGVEWELDLPALVARLEEFIVRARDVMGVAV